MKKILALVMVLAMVLALAACGAAKPAEAPTAELPADDPTVKSEGVMTYAEYAAAPLDSPSSPGGTTRPPSTPRTPTAATSCTTWPAPKRTMPN